MKIVYRTPFMLLLLIEGIAMPCCDGGRCAGNYDFANFNSLNFRVVDKHTGANLLLIGSTHYDLDSIRLCDDHWKEMSPLNSEGAFVLVFADQTADRGVVNTTISRSFYVYFDQTDIDTLDISFQFEYDHCHDEVMRYFKAVYNDSIYFDEPVSLVPGLTFYK